MNIMDYCLQEVTDWDEVPPNAREHFLENIVCGIWVHNGILEIMSPKRTVKKYTEYVKLYEDKNKNLYHSEYYNDNGIVQADTGYLKRCIESYGLNADEELRKIRWQSMRFKETR